MRVCVIGAGASGLCAARHLLAAGVTPLILDRAPELGGTWVYTETTGYDQHGLPVHTSMYKSLRTNLPKEVMGFPDFPVPKQQKSYLPAKDILAFLQQYSDYHDITRHIKFNHFVKNVKPLGDGWTVEYEDLVKKQSKIEEFDAIMVCNGHYNTPFIPQINGIETFKGDVMHSHDYRVPEVFASQKVLVIGAGPSGMDIAVEICRVTKKVFLSHHLKDNLLSIFPDNLQQKPDVLEINGTRVVFIDGTEEEIDAVFFCTGYLYSYPFLDSSCGITVEDNVVQPLYKHLVNIEHPTMCLVGIPYYVCAFSMFDLQVRFFIKALQGYFELPSKEEMYKANAAESEERESRGFTKRQTHMMGPYQALYYESLASEGGLDSLPPVMTNIHNHSSDMFLDDIVHFRDYNFQENYHLSLSSESGINNLPSVLTKITEESVNRFKQNMQSVREDVYKIINDDTYAVVSSNGDIQVIC